MRSCPNCAYLLPDAGDRCLRCHAPVLAAPTPVPFAAATVSAPGPAPSAPSGDLRYAAPARIGFGDPLPNPAASPFEKVPTPGGQWSPAAPPPKKGPWKSLVTIGVLVALVAFCYAGWNHVQAQKNRPPAATREYVAGDGITYMPVGQGYSVRLPLQPIEQVASREYAGRTVASHNAVVSEADYEMFVSSGEVGVIPPEAVEAGLAGVAVGLADAVGGEVTSQKVTDHDGYTALDATIDGGDDYEGRARAIYAGTRVYLLVVHSKGGAAVLLDELTDSFQVF